MSEQQKQEFFGVSSNTSSSFLPDVNAETEAASEQSKDWMNQLIAAGVMVFLIAFSILAVVMSKPMIADPMQSTIAKIEHIEQPNEKAAVRISFYHQKKRQVSVLIIDSETAKSFQVGQAVDIKYAYRTDRGGITVTTVELQE